MKTLKPQELRALSATEIQLKLDELEESLQNLKLQHVQKQLADPSALRQTRRDIARVRTLVREAAAPLPRVTQPTAQKGRK